MVVKIKNKKEKITIDDLAVMINNGFNEMKESNDREHKEIGERIESLRKENTRDHEDMALRLDSVAYGFELVALKKRVDVLERNTKMHA